jgi:hypothetical protein
MKELAAREPRSFPDWATARGLTLLLPRAGVSPDRLLETLLSVRSPVTRCELLTAFAVGAPYPQARAAAAAALRATADFAHLHSLRWLSALLPVVAAGGAAARDASEANAIVKRHLTESPLGVETWQAHTRALAPILAPSMTEDEAAAVRAESTGPSR